MKRTLVLGASPNPSRYSNMAANRLMEHGHEVVLVGKRAGTIQAQPILLEKPDAKEIDTITLYLNPENQKEFYPYILSLQPKRIVFNPGTENPELEQLAANKGIETIEACTLVMLSVGNY